MRKYCPDCMSGELIERPEAGYGDIKCGDCGAVFGEANCIVPPPEPDPRPDPRFAVGDEVWAFNGEPRVVTGVSWNHSVPTLSSPEINWYWWLMTVHPDDPKRIGQGVECSYRLREATNP